MDSRRRDHDVIRAGVQRRLAGLDGFENASRWHYVAPMDSRLAPKRITAEAAAALITIAHPDFRSQLEREARDANLIPKGFF